MDVLRAVLTFRQETSVRRWRYDDLPISVSSCGAVSECFEPSDDPQQSLGGDDRSL